MEQKEPQKSRPAPPSSGKKTGKPAWLGDDRIGTAVLAAGILAVLIVLSFALSGGGDSAAPTAQGSRQALQSDAKTRILIDPPRISAKIFEGTWSASIPEGIASFVMQNGMYQIIVAKAAMPSFRKFSRGVAYIDGDSLVLMPKSDMGKPDDANIKYTYYSMTMRTFAVHPEMNDGKMIWTRGTAVSVRARDNKAGHPIFRDMNGKSVVWIRTK